VSARRLPCGRLRGAIRVPGSKSVTNRALLAAACARGESVLLNPLDSSDTRALAAAVQKIGAKIFFEGASWRIVGPIGPRGDSKSRAELRIDVGDAGTPARFLAALLPIVPGRYTLDGSPRMRERPMSPLFEAIRALGGEVTCLGREGFLPVAIRGGTLRGGRVAIRGDVSSQFLSALELVSPLVPGGIALDVAGPIASASYLALTQRVRDAFGGAPGEGYRPARFLVPGDDSAACFPIAGALVSQGRVVLRGLARDSEQPDAVFRAWSVAAGGTLGWEADDDGGEALVVTGPRGGARGLRPFEADVDAVPDAALPLATALAFAAGTSRLSGVARLRDKESDRLSAALDLLGRCGALARVEAGPGGAPVLAIEGASGAPRAAAFSSHGDHRVAMSTAVLALALPDGSTLDDEAAVRKSWPRFWEAWTPLVVPADT
jgi:3-phosphoshikimate 1-carboxyvinyltransferase